MAFDQKTAKLSDQRLETALGRYFFSRQKELILDLVAPRAGERMLVLGFDTGNYIQLFREKGCSITGIDSAAERLSIARDKSGDGAKLLTDNLEELPFADDEFDVVLLIHSLELSGNPQKALAEAIRVCRGRVFIGFLNKYSLVGTKQRLKELFGLPLTADVRFFSIDEIKSMVRGLIATPSIKWGSVIYFPAIVYSFFTEMEEMFPAVKNPMGAFAGLIFPVKYTYRTAQNPLTESFKLETEARRTAPEAVRGMLQEADK